MKIKPIARWYFDVNIKCLTDSSGNWSYCALKIHGKPRILYKLSQWCDIVHIVLAHRRFPFKLLSLFDWFIEHEYRKSDNIREVVFIHLALLAFKTDGRYPHCITFRNDVYHTCYWSLTMCLCISKDWLFPVNKADALDLLRKKKSVEHTLNIHTYTFRQINVTNRSN